MTADPTPTRDSPSGVWFAMEEGARSGPWSLGALHDRVAAKLVTAESLVWTDGMPDWLPLREVFAPDGTLRALPATQGRSPSGVALPLPVVEAERFDTPPGPDEPRSRAPHPWRRWFARMLDAWCLSFLYAMVLVGLGRRADDGQIVHALVLLLLMVPAETAALALAGTTPGKWLLNVRVREADGRRLSWSRALARALHVWLFGMCAGIPLLSLFAMGHQYGLLTQRGTTSYDDRGRYVVSHGPIDGRRQTLLATSLALVIFLIVAGMVLKEV